MANDSLVLGADIMVLRVRVTTDADFAEVLEHQDDSGVATNWPSGSTVSLVIDGTAYNATVSGTDAAWVVDKATADTWTHGAVAILKVVNGTTDEVWALGTVVRLG